MAQKIIKHRLFTWFEVTPNPVDPGGPDVLTERINIAGDDVDITNEDYVKRGEELDAFFTDEEADQVRAGTYNGPGAEQVYYLRQGAQTAPHNLPRQIGPADGEHGDTASMSSEELADYINEHKLNVDQTVALAGDDLESIEKVLDAENLATDNDPRKGVTDRLEAKMNAATTG
jgi:hypothetical protein